MWSDRAACRNMNQDLWFAQGGPDAALAKSVCSTCPVRAECLAAGMDEAGGIWGGLTESERFELRHGRRPGEARRDRSDSHRAYYLRNRERILAAKAERDRSRSEP